LVTEGDGVLDEHGAMMVELDTAAAKASHGDKDHRYTVVAEVVDPSRRLVRGEGEVIVTRADAVVNWVRRHSVWPMPMGLACCAIELMAAGGSRFDIARFGMEVMRFSPRQADCMIVAGTVTYKMAEVVRRIYDQMAEPKWVVAMGACASSGGMYRSYATLQGVDRIVPVDIYISGCPPRPEALLDGMMLLQEKIRQEGGSLRRTFKGRTIETKVVG
jgi:NADH-quinone oxidoreductase subunit B